MIQTKANSEKPHFEPDLGPLLGHRQLSSCTISEKLMIQS